ncbi:DNA-directed DNA polymerase [Halorussus aquaticus]|uniref:DNA polymerase n=1 Tax=Halorussus aquaticus TaxID=2953748 RepID=A0ABD5PYY5_9EURY|nr:DNA-directed DNA polymerase [Halorussus aquaticus]
MSDSGSTTTLTDFSDGGDDERDVEAEARAVAGGDHQRADAVVGDDDWLPDPEGEVELSVVQIDYTVEGSGDDEEPVVHVFGRTDDQRLEHVKVYDFEPYFYAPAENVDDERIAQYEGLLTYRETDENGEPFESIRGERLVKIIGRTPRDVGQVRDEFDHYEADILFPNRLLIDKDIKSGVRLPERRDDDGDIRISHEEIEPVDANITPRVNTFDIEVDDRQGFPEDGEETIVCLTSHDSYRDEYVNWLYQSPAGVDGPAALAGYDPIEDDFEADVRVFEEEEAMLEAFVEYVEKTDPDILTGWNFADFDAPYFLDRMEQLQGSHHDYDLDIDRLSRVNEVWRSDWNGPDVKGRVVFDLLRAYKSTQRTELESYRLDAVGEVELGVGKERYSGDIGDLWENDPERLLEYNLRDVELCVELDRKQDIVAFFEEVASFVGCKLEDAPTAGDAVDMYVLHKAYGEFALPSKGTVESGEEFEGGAVFEPITGVRENVSVLDLKSLYPMCMWTVNASPETKVDPDEYDGETYRTPTGQHFQKEPAGMMREMIEELLTEREEKKELRDQHEPGTEPYERYDNQQASVKVVMNSLYGVSGWDRFRLYDKDNAAAVTATGRDVINYTEETVSDFGYEVIYGDTDSVMLEIGDDVGTEEVIENSFALEKRINESYDDFARENLDAEEHRFQIEFEKLYRRFFQAGTKKRYAGHIVWKEGKDVDDIDITGFEYKRSDIAPITKTVQKQVIDMIVHGEDLDDVKDYVHDVIEDYQNGNVNLDDVGIPGGIGKRLDDYDTDTAQVRGAKYANLMLGTNFQRGSKPKRLYLEGVHPDFWQRMESEGGFDPSGNSRKDRLYREFKKDPDVICFEFADQVPPEFEVDWDKMLDKTLQGPIERILEALSISWDEVKSGQEQTGLGSFV